MHTYIYRNIKINYTDYYVPLGLVYLSQVELATYFLKHHIFFYSYEMTYYFYFHFYLCIGRWRNWNISQ